MTRSGLRFGMPRTPPNSQPPARPHQEPVRPSFEALLQASDQHRKRADDLMALALELGSSLRLPDLVRTFTAHACNILDASASVLALAQGDQLEVVAVHDPAVEPDRAAIRALNRSLTTCATAHPGSAGRPAAEFLGN